MTKVTVDLEDLERIVFAASAVKAIEGSLAAWRRDPFVQPHLDFTDAQKRLESAMRNATRGQLGTLVNFDAPLTKEEINALQYVMGACDAKNPGLALFVISPEDKGEPGRQMSVYDQLAAKGCIEVGQFVQGVVWAGADRPQIVADPKGYAARPTRRGLEKLQAATMVAPLAE